MPGGAPAGFCAVPTDGSIGTCKTGWSATCGNGVCEPFVGENFCNCRIDCCNAECGSCIDFNFAVFPADPCLQIFSPVCGCDNLTYMNDCNMLLSSHVAKLHDGMCASHCLIDADCNGGATCSPPVPENNGFGYCGIG